MKLFLKGHDLSFAAQQIYMCMFPDSYAEFCDECPENGDFIISSLEKRGKEFYSKTEIHFSESVICGEFSLDSAADNEEDIKREKKRAVKTSFYNAAVKLCKTPPAWGALTGIRPAKVAAKFLDLGFDAESAKSLMQKEYFVSPERADLAVKCACRANALSNYSDIKNFSLYVGIPFCVSRCRYCSFVSHSIENAGNLVTPYLKMLKKELEGLGKVVRDANLKLCSVYIGGGTPTALSDEELGFVMQTIAENFRIPDAAEYTVEGGRPDTITKSKIKLIHNLGATRISVNPQTMNDEILAAMDRRHTAEDVCRAIEDVRAEGGLAINTDLIAGLPGDTPESFENTINRVLGLSPENITVHTLALKKGSALRCEKYKLPSGEITAGMVNYAMNALMPAGYEPYYLYRQKYMSGNLENVGYSKPGFENLYNSFIMDELHTIISAGAGGVTKLVDRKNAEISRIFNPKYPYEYNIADEKISSTAKAVSEFFKKRGM